MSKTEKEDTGLNVTQENNNIQEPPPPNETDSTIKEQQQQPVQSKDTTATTTTDNALCEFCKKVLVVRAVNQIYFMFVAPMLELPPKTFEETEHPVCYCQLVEEKHGRSARQKLQMTVALYAVKISGPFETKDSKSDGNTDNISKDNSSKSNNISKDNSSKSNNISKDISSKSNSISKSTDASGADPDRSKFHCKTCDEYYTSRSILRKHLETAHAMSIPSRKRKYSPEPGIIPDLYDPKNYCSSCKAQFNLRQSYYIHLKAYHKDVFQTPISSILQKKANPCELKSSHNNFTNPTDSSNTSSLQ